MGTVILKSWVESLEVSEVLPPYIIEEIRKREEERKRHERWPRVELPMEPPPPDWMPEQEPGSEREEDTPSVVDFMI